MREGGGKSKRGGKEGERLTHKAMEVGLESILRFHLLSVLAKNFMKIP